MRIWGTGDPHVISAMTMAASLEEFHSPNSICGVRDTFINTTSFGPTVSLDVKNVDDKTEACGWLSSWPCQKTK
jgi:hypothetical protein